LNEDTDCSRNYLVTDVRLRNNLGFGGLASFSVGSYSYTKMGDSIFFNGLIEFQE